MTKNFLKRLSIILSASLFVRNSCPVLAYELDNDKNSIESVEYQNTKDEDFENFSVVYAELASIYKVTIPKALVLSGVEKDTDYFVKVEGDIAGYEAISVIPDNSLILSTKNKENEIATINQNKTQWRYNDFAINANGNISAPGITAGKWQGTFNFYLSLDKVLGDVITLPEDEKFSLNLQYGDYNALKFEEGKTYTSSNPEIFEIDENKNIIAKGEGTAFIIVIDNAGNTKQIPVTVRPADNISFNIDTLENNEIKIEEGKFKTINLKSTNTLNLISPRFESANKEIATVDENGNIIGINKGITTITIYSDNSIPKTVTVIIDKPGEVSMSLNNDKVETLKMSGDSKTLNFATKEKLTFESEDEEILAVDENGKIVAKNIGTTFITVKDKNGNVKKIKVTINPSDNIVPSIEEQEVKSVNLVATEKKTFSIVSNDTLILKNVKYISNNPEIVTVDENGNIKATGEGTTTITIKSDNSIDKIVTVTVSHNYVEGTCTYCGDMLPALQYSSSDSKNVYDGKGHNIAVISEGNTIQYSTDNKTWLDESPIYTNAGTYTIFYKITKPTYKTIVGSNIITIEKADGSITPPTTKSLTYNGSAQALVNAGSSSTGTIQYSLDNEIFNTAIPTGTNAGTYTVYYKVIGDNNHNDVVVNSLTTTISKVASSVKTAPTAKTLTYNGKAQALVNAGVANYGTMQYSLDNKTFSATIPTGTNAGTYTVYYKVAGDANHNNTSAKSISVTIEKAAGNITAPTTKSLTYNGSAQALINAGSSSTGTIQYSLNNSSWSTSIPTGTNAGSYTVYYKVVSTNSNYNDVASKSINITIAKKAGYINTKPTAKSLAFTGGAQALVNAGGNASGTIQYSLNNSTWSTAIPTAVNSGTYTVYYKVDASANYNAVGTQSVSVYIDSCTGVWACYSVRQPVLNDFYSAHSAFYTLNEAWNTSIWVTVNGQSTYIKHRLHGNFHCTCCGWCESDRYATYYLVCTRCGRTTSTGGNNVEGNYGLIGTRCYRTN